MKISRRNKFDLIHKISRLIVTNYIQIQDIGAQEKKTKLGLFRSRKKEVSNLIYNYINWINKFFPYKPIRH